jgi:hypothetical protein
LYDESGPVNIPGVQVQRKAYSVLVRVYKEGFKEKEDLECILRDE